MKVNEWLKNSLFRPYCVLCLAPTSSRSLCDDCFTDLPWLSSKQCSICALPLEVSDAVCGGCLQNPPAFNQCKALFRYGSPIDMMISQFKYQGDLAVGELLSDILTLHLPFKNSLPDFLIPMPLHASRLQERGFNQASILANALSTVLHVPVDHHICKRVRATAHQMGLNAGVRKKNLRHAFACSELVKDKSVAIVDDVVTTGATVNELASTLRRAGARHIDVWCLARTPTP